MEQPIKVCTKCGIEKLLSDFYVQRAKKDGHRSQCITCVAEYRKANAEKNRLYQIAYGTANRALKNQKAAEYRAANRKRIAEKQRQYSSTNPHIQRNWAKANPEKSLFTIKHAA